ncbi:ankyrin 3 [Fusarium beomiforme]|uniref:Ankyrin 3 n=1 Tax=Fusarium beomiforme TaxID=44412 RepID=A0A9P5DWW0_9HYPO|nr:ankyrin 3 [Fusarium beomiforme]
MATQYSFVHEIPPDTPLVSLASHRRFSKAGWRRLRQKISRRRRFVPAATNGSSTTVDSSDIDTKGGVLAAAYSDLSYPMAEWGHQTIHVVSVSMFLKFFHNFIPPSASPNHGYYRSHGNTSHRVHSSKVDKASHKGKGTLRITQNTPGSHGGSSGGGRKGTGRGGNNGKPPPKDGHRYPSVTQPPKIFGCPFYVTDPITYHECSNIRLRRTSDVSGHLARRHLLQDKILGTGRGHGHDVESADEAETVEEMQQTGTCKSPNDIKLYHANCRKEFFGPTASEMLKRHTDDELCPSMGTEETGMLLPREFQTLLSESKKVNSSVAKWYAMWRVCFPSLSTSKVAVPPSPYLDMTVSREHGRQVVSQALSHMFVSIASLDLICDQIISRIYLGKSHTDAEVQQIVRDQQQQRTIELQQAQYGEQQQRTIDLQQTQYGETFPPVPTYPELQPPNIGYNQPQDLMDLEFAYPANLIDGNPDDPH